MAIYELRCREGHRFEIIQSFTAPCRTVPSAARPPARSPAGSRRRAGLSLRRPPR
ncbi:hypothetical protein ACFQX6_26445 [Streptosporangium lutulentum]